MFFKILRLLELVFFYTGVILGVLFVLLLVLWLLATPADGRRYEPRPEDWPNLMDAETPMVLPASGHGQ